MNDFDVIVIGAGPAGAATALFLRNRGYRVVALDQAWFPRDKVCGEFISPAADAILEELGILSLLEAQSPLRLKGVYISAYGQDEVHIDYPPIPNRPGRASSLSVPRMTFDNILANRARENGVDLREQHKVHDLLFQDGRVVGVKGRDHQNTHFSITAKVVVDAGGRNCVSIRRLNLRRHSNDSGKVAIAAHWRGVRLIEDYCYMHISRPGYTGITPVGPDSVNVVLVVDSHLLQGREVEDFYVATVLNDPLRKQLLGSAKLGEKPRTVESLAYSVKSPECGGLVLVGDAAGFIDPFTGEGIYLSLRSAQLVAETIDLGFRRSDFSREHFAGFESARNAEFHKKFLLSRIIQSLIYKPPVCAQVVKTLAENPTLAEELVGVIGDYLPAEQVVSMKFLMKFVARAIWPEGLGRPANKKGFQLARKRLKS